MTDSPPRIASQIKQLLDEWFEVEFTFLRVDEIATSIADLPRDEQDFLLSWIQRAATTHIQIAYHFALRAPTLLAHMERRVIEAWALHAMDAYDRAGISPAVRVIKEVEHFTRLSHERTAGVVFEDISGVMLNFVHGLSGRRLKLEQDEAVFTDSETLFLPAVIARMQAAEDNFILCKAMVTMMWAQTRFGSFRPRLSAQLSHYDDTKRALKHFQTLETLRLEACIARELPGLYREMQRLRAELHETLPDSWLHFAQELGQPDATVEDSLRLMADAYAAPTPPDICYQGELRPDIVATRMDERINKEKILLRVKLAQLEQEITKHRSQESRGRPAKFGLTEKPESEPGLTALELTLDGAPIAPPDDVRQLLTSIQLDLGEIPPEYLVAAGPGEYDPRLYEEKTSDPDDVWQGTYHEEGASLYPEWDYGRQHYRKNWCVMREKDVTPVYDGFRAATLGKYSGLVKHLRKTFEAMRDENRLLKRQVYGDNVDIDALVEALADARDGSEMSDRLFMRMHRTERNIAVMFMVDMSGSTRGWINDAERESLVLLSEALETLGDRYAIYGFSGTTRKRCELFRIKHFDEPYNEEVQARISGIRPQEYTRMGFAIRHLTSVLNEVEARTKLLITLSDGKPDDYHDNYRTQYGIEDTRKALQEAQRSGIHPFCITLDEKARDYLPHLYGAVNYTVIDEVSKLPFKVADIYRRLTT
ncbi:MAG: nitric oxide reductase activation protein [Gammaproteobacteria bacterium]|nr:nitric oxide reductase activation protein [Gammaproteobacteria bacterium]MBU1731147.1 nitric oxide reductase activation protein [Gammaproteobacteria bacterium]MBU1891458.1 nitric oxide reductase activation protein [Gammaproteobacteria bacterium]